MFHPAPAPALAGALALFALSLFLGPASARAQGDYGRPGLYVGGSWVRGAERFDDDLDRELDGVLPFDSVDADVDDFGAWGVVLGLRSSAAWSTELVAEQYRELRIDATSALGVTARADLELRTALVMTKFYVLGGPVQPWFALGFGVIDARAESGGLSVRGTSGLGRAGLGVDLYLARNWAVSLHGSYSRAATTRFEDLGYFSFGGTALLRF